MFDGPELGEQMTMWEDFIASRSSEPVDQCYRRVSSQKRGSGLAAAPSAYHRSGRGLQLKRTRNVYFLSSQPSDIHRKLNWIDRTLSLSDGGYRVRRD
jgi:hypothetical protein